MNKRVTLAALLLLCTLLPVMGQNKPAADKSYCGTGEGVTQPAVMTTPPDRRFTLNSELYFSFFVYNAPANPAVQTKLFRDGKLVKSVPPVPIDVTKKVDQTTDKQVPATQWVQFEIVK